MRIGQKTIVRWIAKRVAGRGQQGAKALSSVGFELDTRQLRQVSGGSGTSTGSPNRTW
jgi:hypothetical protein